MSSLGSAHLIGSSGDLDKVQAPVDALPAEEMPAPRSREAARPGLRVRLAEWVAAGRGRLFLWVPVALGGGVGLWFALPWEPGPRLYAAALAALAALAAVGLRAPEALRPVATGLACLALGFLSAGLRAHLVAAPMLDIRYYGAVEGRVVEIDRSSSDRLRITLDRVVLDDVAPDRTPAVVRLSLYGPERAQRPETGQRVMATAFLSAPGGAVEPGGFDFRRMAYFGRLGAVGYTRTPVLVVAPPEAGAQWIGRLRQHLSSGIRAAIPGDAGAFAAGVMTGDQSGLSRAAVADLRDSSLAHLLAISGMNMAFVTGFVFALVRYGAALVPPLALRTDTRKAAAVAAFVAAAFYLALSGASVSAERAFLMVAVMLGAVLLDRRAVSLRSVAIAATVLLVLQPESLLDPGFQMSFAATIALIAGFEAMRGRARALPRWAAPVFGLVLSSLIGGLATAPFAAAHFNRMADLGFFANLLTVPVMGAVVMPAGVLAALVAPLGLQAIPLWVMGKGSEWILWVARRFAAMEGAVTAIPAPGPAVLPLVALGALVLLIVRGRMRLAGFAPLALAAALWGGGVRPDLLVSAEGNLAGLMTEAGRSLSSDAGAGFAAGGWLENDGDLATQAMAAARPAFTGPRNARRFGLGPWRGVVLKGKAAPALVEEACRTSDLVILAGVADPPAGCRLIDRRTLDRTGALAFRLAPDGALLVTPAAGARRLWSAPEPGTPGPDLAARMEPPRGQ